MDAQGFVSKNDGRGKPDHKKDRPWLMEQGYHNTYYDKTAVTGSRGILTCSSLYCGSTRIIPPAGTIWANFALSVRGLKENLQKQH
jgi:hypothetical protein